MADPGAFQQLRETIPALRHFHCLNSGGVAPTPQQTLDAQRRWLEREALQTNAHADLRAEYLAELCALRADLARLIGAHPDEIALNRAVSEAISFVAGALDLQRGDRVILSAEEHPSGYLPWITLRERLGVEVTALDVSRGGAAFMADLERAVDARTRAICLSHVTTERGIVLPVADVCALARARGIVTVVDAAQSFGARPTNVQRLGCDVMAFPAFKWSMGPAGVGAMYVRRQAQDRLRPPGSGGGAAAVYDFPPGRAQLHPNAQRYEYGARPYALYAAWRASLQLLDDLGPAEIQARNAALAAQARRAFHGVAGARTATPDQGDARSGILTVGLDGAPGADLAEHCLRAHRIICRPAHRGSAVRFCFHAFSGADDVQAAADALAAYRPAGG